MYLNVQIISKTSQLKQNWKLFDAMRQENTIYNKNVLQTLRYG